MNFAGSVRIKIIELVRRGRVPLSRLKELRDAADVRRSISLYIQELDFGVFKLGNRYSNGQQMLCW